MYETFLQVNIYGASKRTLRTKGVDIEGYLSQFGLTNNVVLEVPLLSSRRDTDEINVVDVESMDGPHPQSLTRLRDASTKQEAMDTSTFQKSSLGSSLVDSSMDGHDNNGDSGADSQAVLNLLLNNKSAPSLGRDSSPLLYSAIAREHNYAPAIESNGKKVSSTGYRYRLIRTVTNSNNNAEPPTSSASPSLSLPSSSAALAPAAATPSPSTASSGDKAKRPVRRRTHTAATFLHLPTKVIVKRPAYLARIPKEEVMDRTSEVTGPTGAAREKDKEERNEWGEMAEMKPLVRPASGRKKRRSVKSYTPDNDPDPPVVFKCGFPKCGAAVQWRRRYGKTRLVNHVRLHADKAAFKCPHCEFTAKVGWQIRYHHRLEHADIDWVTPTYVDTEADVEILSKLWKSCFDGTFGEPIPNQIDSMSVLK